MAANRRKLITAGLSCVSSLINRSVCCQSRRRIAVLPTVLRRHWMTLSVTGALCAVPFIQKQESLSHEELVRRSLSLVTDSSNTFLSQTTLALLDSLTCYVKAISSLITLHNQYVESISKASPAEEEAIWQFILLRRQEIIQMQKDCQKFESFWMTAINLSEVAAEAAFNADARKGNEDAHMKSADHASVRVRANLQVAQSQVKHAQKLSIEAEKKLNASNAVHGRRLQNSQSTSTEEDEDIPDAYLRED